MNLYTQKLLSFLRVRAVGGGLEVSDQILRLVYFNGKKWQMVAARLEPGVLQAGRIKNADAFRAALHVLRGQVAAVHNKNKKVNVVVALSSVPMYSQMLNLPLLEGDDLQKAVELNVQMLSPFDAGKSYSGWQLEGRDEKNLRLELAAAFVDKDTVDEMAAALFEAGFLAIAVESRALALSRIVRERGSGIDIARPYLMIDIDNSGLEFLIIRNGQVYFEYAVPWVDLVDEKGETSLKHFEDVLAASIRKVTNFYEQHWPEPLAAVILSAVAFREAAERAVAASSPLPVIVLSLTMDKPISSEWLVGLGCSLRGFRSDNHNKEINLAGDKAGETFRREQMLHFLELWRVLVPVAFAILVAMFVLANNFLAGVNTNITSHSSLTLGGAQTQTILNLEASSTQFNNLVALVTTVQQYQTPQYKVLGDIMSEAGADSILITEFSIQPGTNSAMLVGTSPSEEDIVDFKSAIEKNPRFGPVNLPLAAIKQNGTGFSFSMTFPISAAAYQ